MKEFKKLGFSDRFMFNTVMEDPELCRRVLETLLQTKLSELTMPLSEKEVKATKDGKAIRLDVFTQDSVSGAVFDTEMQNLNRKSVDSLALPKRSRYYQAMIDIKSLDSGNDYQELADSNIIFICTFDPFGKGSYKYSFRECCEDNPELKLKTGTAKIFFNTTSESGDMPEEIRYLFEYINTGKPLDELTGDIETMIDSKRDDFELSVRWLREYFDREDARYEGREEGREEGRMQARIDSIATFLSNGGTKEMLKQFLNATDEEIELAEKKLDELNGKL